MTPLVPFAERRIISMTLSEIEKALVSFLPEKDEYIKTVVSAMEYSLTAGGKRIRPMLTLQFAKLCGGSEECALPFACAVEMIHTYSLIHDDLPCMDDDDLRRGKPTNHKVFGEAAAVLAGDALLTLAFETVLSEKAAALNGFAKCAEAGKVLASCAGAEGMIGGQIIDIESANEARSISLERLRVMDEKKTGALIKAACLMGCISAGADETQKNAAVGKPIGSDSANNKSTYVSLLGLDECKKLASRLTDEAISSLSVFSNGAEDLTALALSLRDRNQ